ncbi:RNA exonuclease 5 [Aulostomus maculatus]
MVGSGPRVSVLPDRLQHPITLKELTELLHYAALGKTGGITQPSWCRLHQQRKVTGVNVVLVEGLTQTHFYKHYLRLRRLRTTYTTRLTFTPPPTNAASGIFSSELPELNRSPGFPKDEENSRLHKVLRSHPVITRFGRKTRGLTAYVLTQEEMIKTHFPVKGMPGFEGFVCTDSADVVTDRSPLYGLDCEMCLTVKGYELARVSLVASDGACVLDDLVKPQNRILNYVTEFSGITAAMLRPVTTTLRDVQAKLKMLLPRDAVLVGHSLNNDLVALKLIHRHVIDTSLLYRKEFGQRFKLKVLAESVLKRQIQTEKSGHNPTEDAVAALELAQYFIKTGPLQVVESHLEELWGCSVEEESVDSAPAPTPTPTPSTRFAEVLQTLGRSLVFVGKRSDVALHLSNQQWHSSDKEVLDAFRRQSKSPSFSVLQLSSFSNQLEHSSPRQEQQFQQLCANLRDMCVVFAGPLPAGFTERDVRRLFRCCGRVQKIKMLRAAVRLHAAVEFELLEGAMLALKTLDGITVQGLCIKVQRPVHESTLDVDVTLEALMSDTLNARRIYAVRLNRSVAESIHTSAKVNGHVSDSKGSGVTPDRTLPPVTVNGHSSESEQLSTKTMSEETLTQMFSRFGSVDRIELPTKPGKHARHAHIQFQCSEGKLAALRSSEHLRKEHYLVCPSLTPLHMPSWVATTTSVDAGGEAAINDDKRTHTDTDSQDQEMELMMKKLDRRLGKLYTSLPECTLSVVVLLGCSSTRGLLPGLCFVEVKQGSRGEQ